MGGSWRILAPLKSKSVVMGNCLDPAHSSQQLLCPVPQLFFEDSIDDAKYCGRLYGLGTGVAQKQSDDVDSAPEKMSILALISSMQQ